MDFKTRFQGKISHISKEGDNVIMSTVKMVPIGKTPAYNGIGGLNTPSSDSAPISKMESSNSILSGDRASNNSYA